MPGPATDARPAGPFPAPAPPVKAFRVISPPHSSDLVVPDDLKLQLDYQRSDAPGLSDGENKVLARLQVVF
ncbi:MAG: hypothetical protein EXS58_07095 [Candidatus Latescibacteria bacterium]|nr:hypothetical protein [Candidatus Latescibacterota bacterium]